MATSRGVGQYVASEAHTACFGRPYKTDATRRPIIYFTGGPGDDRDFLTSTASGGQIAPRLADLGVLCASAAFGGANQWANDTTQARIASLFSYIPSAFGTKSDQFVGIGVSKGASALLRYTRNNPTKVAALLLIVPAVDMVDIHDNDRGGNAANIETAFTNLAGWNAAKASVDPTLNAATHASQAIPTKILYGGSDTVCTPTSVTSFATTIGATAVNIGSALGHLDTGSAVDPVEDVWKFIAAYL